jgi:hypothetical protein
MRSARMFDAYQNHALIALSPDKQSRMRLCALMRIYLLIYALARSIS